MRVSYRTYPQPDSPAPNIGPRERALACLKYLAGEEPDVTNPRHRSFDPEAARAVAAAYVLYETVRADVVEDSAVAIISIFATLGDVLPVTAREHPLFGVVLNSLRQEIRRRNREPLAPSETALLTR